MNTPPFPSATPPSVEISAEISAAARTAAARTAADPHPDRPVEANSDANVEQFLICGFGSLGQLCALNLQLFASQMVAISIRAIDIQPPDFWEDHEILDQLSQPPLIGDCRQDSVLKTAGVETCRAVLIVTSDDSVNIEAAIAVRRLNPTTQIVVRSARSELNRLLQRHLGNFVALDAAELPARAFALAAIGDGTLSVFNLGTHRFRVVEAVVRPGNFRFDNVPVYRLQRRNQRLIALQKPQGDREHHISPSQTFHGWQPQTRLTLGDRITYVEVINPETDLSPTPVSPRPRRPQRLRAWIERYQQEDWWQKLRSFANWEERRQIQRLFVISLSTALILWTLGTVLLKASLVDSSWQKAASLGVILLLGGYGDVFGGLESDLVPAWVQVICLLITLTSVLIVLGLLGVVIEQLLSARFELLQRRLRLPRRDHVVVLGLGRVGYGITKFLASLQQPLVVICQQVNYPDLLERVPLLTGNVLQELDHANLATARSIVAVTNDQMLNLEAVLLASEQAQQHGHHLPAVIRTSNQHFSDNLVSILPRAQAFSAYALSAQAFAGAAFGENIISLFPLGDRIVLVTEYQIEVGDTLEHKLLSQVAYGYGVVPILHGRGATAGVGVGLETVLPSDDLRLQSGDRLVMLASINGLRRIEHGELMPPPRWRLELQRPINMEFTLSGGNTLANIVGIDLDEARQLMAQLPLAIEVSLYDHQAERLVHELKKNLPARLERLT